MVKNVTILSKSSFFTIPTLTVNDIKLGGGGQTDQIDPSQFVWFMYQDISIKGLNWRKWTFLNFNCFEPAP